MVGGRGTGSEKAASSVGPMILQGSGLPMPKSTPPRGAAHVALERRARRIPTATQFLRAESFQVLMTVIAVGGVVVGTFVLVTSPADWWSALAVLAGGLMLGTWAARSMANNSPRESGGVNPHRDKDARGD
jgi:hypothetical protein